MQEKNAGAGSAAGKLIPGLRLLTSYKREWLRADVIAGVTIFTLMVPSAMSYGDLAGVAPVVGLYAALAAMLLYPLFGSSRQLIVGPDAAVAILVASAIGPMVLDGDPTRYAALAAALALIVGLIFVLGAIVKVGFMADFLSKPILLGFITGLALITIASQLGKLFGISIESDEFFPQIWELITKLDQAHSLTVAIGLITIAVLVVIRLRVPKLPGPLLVLILAIVLSSLLNWAERGVAVVGEVPAGIPMPAIPDVSISDIIALLPAALGIVLIAFTDSVLTARSFAAKNGYEVDANQELIGFGMANLGSGIFQGFAVSSSASRTAVNDSTGSKTQLVQIVAAGLTVVFLLFFTPLLRNLPSVVLGTIIIVAASSLIEIKPIRALFKIRRSEFYLAIVTLVGVLIVGILPGVVIAVIVSLLNLVGRISRPHDAVLGAVEGIDGYTEIDRNAGSQAAPGLIAYRFDAPLFFANAPYFLTQVRELIGASKLPVRGFLLDAEAIIDIDSTASETMETFLDELASRDIVFYMARVSSPLAEMLERTGLIERIGPENILPSIRTAVQAYMEKHGEQSGERVQERRQ